eukprot:124949_1
MQQKDESFYVVRDVNAELNELDKLSDVQRSSILEFLCEIFNDITSNLSDSKHKNVRFDKIANKFVQFNCLNICIKLLCIAGFRKIKNDKGEKILIFGNKFGRLAKK